MKPLFFSRPAAIRLALLCCLFLSLLPGRAQSAMDERWLLIFDTSAAMKKRQPAVAATLKQVLSTSANGNLHTENSIAVWTFGDKVSGVAPVAWSPAQADTVYDNINALMKKQSFRGNSQLATLRAPLENVIAGSERLTILIFSDGQSSMTGTPYDDGINQSLREHAEERAKSQQPAVIVLRTQRGQFVGASVNFPPGNLNYPSFPPLPEPEPPTPAAPPAAPVVTNYNQPPLVIIGTHVGTNPDEVIPLPPKPETKPEPPPAPPAPPAPPVVTNAAPEPPETNLVVTNPAVVPPVIPAPPTNVPEVTPSTVTQAPPPVPAVVTPPATNAANPAAGHNAPPDAVAPKLIYLGVALLVVAVALVGVFLASRSKKDPTSLITSAIDGPPSPASPPPPHSASLITSAMQKGPDKK